MRKESEVGGIDKVKLEMLIQSNLRAEKFSKRYSDARKTPEQRMEKREEWERGKEEERRINLATYGRLGHMVD